VTVVALGRMVRFAEQAAEELQREDGISCEIVDPRTTSPLDEDTILESVENTWRLVVVDEASPRCGMACDIVARVEQEGFADLKNDSVQRPGNSARHADPALAPPHDCFVTNPSPAEELVAPAW
jgi:pyruvate/2-oxoglutarate/acetoin dehydrogenase E1 component